VSELREQAGRFRENHDAAAFVARAQATAARSSRSLNPLARLGRIGYVAGPLLAAALVLLVVRGRGAGDGARGTPFTTGFTTGAAQSLVNENANAPAAESRFKGGLVVAVVRERGGQQERLTGPFQVRPEDRVRVEVSTDHEGPVAAGLLTDEGEWITLLAPAALEAGTHYSELAARFDESPTHATLIVGDAVAVQRARATRDLAGVVAWRVTSEAGP
jgi:hypothetical protein